MLMVFCRLTFICKDVQSSNLPTNLHLYTSQSFALARQEHKQNQSYHTHLSTLRNVGPTA